MERSQGNKDQPLAQEASGYRLGEGILVGVFTVYVYSLTFAYEVGYCSIYGVPSTFIEISVTRMLIAAAALITLVVFPWVAAFLVYATIPALEPTHPIRLRLRGMSVIIFVVLANYSLRLQLRSYALALLALLAISYFVEPLLSQRKVRGYIEKLRAADRADVVPDTPFRRLVRSMGFTPFLLVLLALLLLTFAAEVGRKEAKSQKTFLTIGEDLVVLRQYGDYFVCGRLISGTKEIDPTIVLVPRNVGSDEKLLLKEIGPLEVRKEARTQPQLPMQK